MEVASIDQQIFMYELEDIRYLWEANRNERTFYVSEELV